MSKSGITITAVIAGSLVLLATAGAQSPSSIGGAAGDQATQLKAQVAALNARIHRLEHAGGSTAHASVPALKADDTSGGGAPKTPTAPGGRAMRVDNIQTVESADTSDQIMDLQDDIDQLQDTYDRSLERLAAEEPRGRDFEGRGRNTRHREVRRRDAHKDALQRSSHLYRAELDRKKKELARLQKGGSTQIIHGTDGDAVITLRTTRDLSEDLNDINVGDTITWTGNRESMSDKAEAWTIRTVSAVGGKSTGKAGGK